MSIISVGSVYFSVSQSRKVNELEIRQDAHALGEQRTKNATRKQLTDAAALISEANLARNLAVQRAKDLTARAQSAEVNMASANATARATVSQLRADNASLRTVVNNLEADQIALMKELERWKKPVKEVSRPAFSWPKKSASPAPVVGIDAKSSRQILKAAAEAKRRTAEARVLAQQADIVKGAICLSLKIPSGKLAPPVFLTQANYESVRSLNLSYTEITDAGLKELAKLPRLTTLYLASTKITDSRLGDIAKLQKLTRLELRNTKISYAGAAELKKALPKCEIYHSYKKD
jgi:hypothetical protein